MHRWFVLAIPYFWLLVFFLAPFAIVLKISLSDTVIAQPPYSPVFDLAEGWGAFANKLRALDLESYAWLTQDRLYVNAFLSSFRIAALSTLITLAVGFPLALGMARAAPRWRALLVMAVILPFWSSFLIRVYAWIGILRTEGFANQWLIALGLIDQPLQMMNTNFAVYIGIVYSYLPFMVLPIYAALERMDHSLVEAAVDLGCSRMEAFWRITAPLALPGIAAGCLLVFIPAMGEFVIPDLLGGSSTLMIGRTLWQEFFSNRDWPVASAVAITLLIILIVPILLLQRQLENQQRNQ